MTTPGCMFPEVPCAFFSGFKSMAIPQECAESLVPVRCGRKEKHPPKLVIILLQACGLDAIKNIRENSRHELVATYLGDGSRLVPREREEERQRDAGEEFSLPARVKSVIGENIFEDVAEGGADLVEPLRARRRRN